MVNKETTSRRNATRGFMTSNTMQETCAKISSRPHGMMSALNNFRGHETSASSGSMPYSFVLANETFGGAISVRYSPIRHAGEAAINARGNIRKINDPHLAKSAENLLQCIENSMEMLSAAGRDPSLFPPLRVFTPDDGSVLIELASRNLRLGFSLESNPNESSWYVVLLTNSGQIGASGQFAGVNLDKLVIHLLSLTLSHL
jgi:hypothetical protein